MNAQLKTSWPASEIEWDFREGRSGRTEHDFDRWIILTAQTRALAELKGWSRSELARQAGVPEGTFSGWYSGKYTGRYDEVNKKIAMFIEAVEQTGAFAERRIPEPGFQKTRTATEILANLDYAHQAGKLVVVTTGAGMGKTQSFKYHCKTRPHASLITMRPHTKTVHGMLNAICSGLGLVQHNPARIDTAIGDYLSRHQSSALMIIDEAQNLVDQAIDQLRYFSDQFGVGIVLGGNEEVYGRFSNRADGPSYAQLKSRVAKRYQRIRPYNEDIKMLIDAWGVTDPEMVKYLTGIGIKPGALRSISETMTLGHMLAAGDNKPLELAHLKEATIERGMGDQS
jgi:hypothetical protein